MSVPPYSSLDFEQVPLLSFKDMLNLPRDVFATRRHMFIVGVSPLPIPREGQDEAQFQVIFKEAYDAREARIARSRYRLAKVLTDDALSYRVMLLPKPVLKVVNSFWDKFPTTHDIATEIDLAELHKHSGRWFTFKFIVTRIVPFFFNFGTSPDTGLPYGGTLRDFISRLFVAPKGKRSRFQKHLLLLKQKFRRLKSKLYKKINSFKLIFVKVMTTGWK